MIKSDDNTVYFDRKTQKDWVFDAGKRKEITKQDSYSLVIDHGWTFIVTQEPE